MCGIAGIVTAGPAASASTRLPLMLASISHRGPDASAWVVSGSAALGTVRLALVDRPTSRQPMSDPSGRYALSFNGEIYNYRELRDELTELGAEFRTTGDTEVLLQSLIVWGQAALRRLRGQFALAFWDAATSTLMLARDRFGIVPLFWHEADAEFAFASEVKALAAGGYRTPLSLPDVIDSGVLWGVHPGRSCFQGVRSVCPGGFITVVDGSVREELYWEFAFAEQRDTTGIDAQAAQLRALFAAAVARRVPEEGDPAVLLSGGLDSSAVLATLRTMLPDSPIDTYSIRFASSALDESPFQQLAAERFGTAHDSIVCDDEAIARGLAEAVRHAESPLVRTAPAATIRLAARIQDRATRAVLSGEGADELFCGYDLFKVAEIRDAWARDPEGPDRLDALEAVMAQQKNLGRAVERAFYEQGVDAPDDPVFSHINRWASAHHITRYLRADLREKYSLSRVLDGVRKRLPQGFETWSAVERAQFLEVRYFLAHTLLANQCDRPYMSHSIEARYPFLDEDVVDYALTLPQDSKLRGAEEKRVVKAAAAGTVPDEIVHRVKQPYTAPEGDAFRSPTGAQLLELHASTAAVERLGVFDPKRVAWLVDKLRRTRTSFHDDLALLWIVSVQMLAAQYGLGDPDDVE